MISSNGTSARYAVEGIPPVGFCVPLYRLYRFATLEPRFPWVLCWKPEKLKYDTSEATQIIRDGIARICANDQRILSKPLAASEALFAFAGWITSLDALITAGRSQDAGVWARLVNEFIKANELEEPRAGWEQLIEYPAKNVLG